MCVRPDLPRYASLPTIEATGERHSWGVFGAGDNIGALNFICPGCRVRAAAEVSTGQVIPLSLPLDQPAPSLVAAREAYRHEVFVRRSGRDDALHGFYLQGSTQWDSLAHIRYREFGYYGGIEDPEVDAGRLGIDHAYRHGLVTRGVLADVAAYRAANGTPLDPTAHDSISAALVAETLAWQGTTVASGDILLVRTGWLGWYGSLSDADRAALAGRLHNGPDGIDAPGLDPAPATPEWLWDHGIAAVATDNASVEVLRVRAEDGYLHRRLIPLLGLMMGELWALDELAAACVASGRHTFLLSAPPLNLRNGVGSPANACAVM